MSIKNNFKEYGIQEWIALIFGTIVMGIQIFRYATNSLADSGLEAVVFALSFMLIFAPKTILDIIRKVRGIDNKSTK